jgi:hypothetical protein
LKILPSGDLGSERPSAISWEGFWSTEIVKGGTFAQPRERQKTRQGQRTEATADFSTAAAKCDAFGRNNDFGGGTLFNKNAMGNYS